MADVPSSYIQSRSVSSNQQGLHKKLETTVTRHLTHPFQRPFADHSLRVFDYVEKQRVIHNGHLIIDSFCGVGESTLHLAQRYPDSLVIGIDKSAKRINKHTNQYQNKKVNNYLIVRADVNDFWRLAMQANWTLYKHYLLYPNPWPKSAHLSRRCHGSPVFPTLIALGGAVELRSNWQVYVLEFAKALAIAGYPSKTEIYRPLDNITPFERKYSMSNQDLWRCICDIKLSEKIDRHQK